MASGRGRSCAYALRPSTPWRGRAAARGGEREPHTSKGAVRVRCHVVPGESQNAVPQQLQVGVARRVALTVAAGTMEFEAVELNGESARPPGVHLVGAGFTVHQGIEGGQRDVAAA